MWKSGPECYFWNWLTWDKHPPASIPSVLYILELCFPTFKLWIKSYYFKCCLKKVCVYTKSGSLPERARDTFMKRNIKIRKQIKIKKKKKTFIKLAGQRPYLWNTVPVSAGTGLMYITEYRNWELWLALREAGIILIGFWIRERCFGILTNWFILGLWFMMWLKIAKYFKDLWFYRMKCLRIVLMFYSLIFTQLD